MKILHVAECIGGVDRYLRSLVKYSISENILILSQRYNLEDYTKLAKKVEIINMHHGIGLNALKEAMEIRKRIKFYKPDIVYAHSSIAGATTRMACIGLNVKVIYNPHGWSFNMGKNSVIYILLERIMSFFCDSIICISDSEKKSALEHKICPEKKLHVIYNGIDFENYHSKNELQFNEKSKFVVGMVGRICRQKAPDTFLKMANEVQKKLDDVLFVIVGDVLESDKDERVALEAYAKKMNINLYITGWVSDPLSYMEKFDVGCLLSRWEGFGLVIPEYMLTGTPIVATNVDAIPYLIKNNENGILVEKDDWRKAAEEVVNLILDERKRIRLINNAKNTVITRFDARRVSKECELLYEELIK